MKCIGGLLASIAVVTVSAGGAGVALGGPAAASTGGCASAASMSTTTKAVPVSNVASAPQAVITDVRVGHHTGCDRVTIEYTGSLGGWRVGYEPKVVNDASGKTVSLEGSAFIGIVLNHTSTTHAAPQPDLKPEFAVLRELRGAGDFEGTTSYGLGLSSKQPFAVSGLSAPKRLVIDIRSTSQVTRVPSGGVATGAGSTSSFPRTTLLIVSAALVLGGAGLFFMRRRIVRR